MSEALAMSHHAARRGVRHKLIRQLVDRGFRATVTSDGHVLIGDPSGLRTRLRSHGELGVYARIVRGLLAEGPRGWHG